jgi:hypothetical protein
MSVQTGITRAQFERALTPDALRMTQIIQLSLMAGSFLFVMIAGFLNLQSSGVPAHRSDEDLFEIFTAISLVLTIVTFVVGQVVFRRIFSVDRLNRAGGSLPAEDLARECVILHRLATLARLAILQAGSFFGVVVCIMGILNGLLVRDPKYWVNLLPVFVMLAFGAATFPSRERVVSTFEEMFGGG